MSLGKHSIANFCGAVVPMLVALATVPAYLHLIGPERYGVLAIFLALLGYFGFFDLGLGRAVTQRMSHFSNATDADRSTLLWTALSTSFLMGLVGSFVLWLCANFILENIITIPIEARNEAKLALLILFVVLPLMLPISALSGALQSRLKYYEVNGVQLFGGVLGQTLPLAVAVSGYLELNYLLSATLLARILTMLLLFYFCRIHVPLVGVPKFNKVDFKHMINYGGWVSLMSILAPLLVTIDRIVIGALSGARAVASYTVPYDLVSRAMVVSGSFSTALFPRLASANEADGKRLALQASNALIAIMTPIVIIGLFVIQPFLEFWVGEEFATSCKWVGEIILLGVWINAIVIPHHARFMAKENPRAVVMIYLFQIPIYLGLLWLGLIHWGIVGAAIAWSARVLIDTFMLLKLNNVLVNTFKATLPSMGLVALAFWVLFLPEIQLLDKLALCCFFTFISLIKERDLLRKLYRNLRSLGK